jgi:hypothetical protein
MLMSWQTDHERAVEFLRDQMNDVDTKITRLESAVNSCEECLELNGLQASLHNIELEREILNELLMIQVTDHSLSLDVLIMRQAEQYRQEANRMAQHWHRGQQTPPDYWDAEVQQAYLTELLGRYHAYHEGRPYYPRTQGPEAGEEIFPWYTEPVPEPQQSTDEANSIREDIFSALRRHSHPFDHLKITVNPGGQVMVTGYAHDDDEREDILRSIMDVASVTELVTDIKITDEAHCPICNPETKNGRMANGADAG